MGKLHCIHTADRWVVIDSAFTLGSPRNAFRVVTLATPVALCGENRPATAKHHQHREQELGQGFRLVPDELKDPDFGLRFAIRAVDPDCVRDIVRRSTVRQGRQDATLVPCGLPIDSVTEVPLALAVPVDLSSKLDETVSYNIKIGSGWVRGRWTLETEDILNRCRVLNGTAPTAALRAGRIELSDGRDGTGTLGGSAAIRWLEARLAIEARQYFLIDGEWHESGATTSTAFVNRSTNSSTRPPRRPCRRGGRASTRRPTTCGSSTSWAGRRTCAWTARVFGPHFTATRASRSATSSAPEASSSASSPRAARTP